MQLSRRLYGRTQKSQSGGPYNAFVLFYFFSAINVFHRGSYEPPSRTIRLKRSILLQSGGGQSILHK